MSMSRVGCRSNGWTLAERLGTVWGCLIVDDTVYLKNGTRSAGALRQYSGTTGRVENPRWAVPHPRCRAGGDRPGAVPARILDLRTGAAPLESVTRWNSKRNPC